MRDRTGDEPPADPDQLELLANLRRILAQAKLKPLPTGDDDAQPGQ